MERAHSLHDKKEILKEIKGKKPIDPLDLPELTTNCTLCGLCKPSCPAYNVLFDEAVSPRGKAILLKENIQSNHLYLCSLCKACEKFCTVPGINIVDNVIRAREGMVESGKETEAGKRMIENIKKYGFAIVKPEQGKLDLFSC